MARVGDGLMEQGVVTCTQEGPCSGEDSVTRKNLEILQPDKYMFPNESAASSSQSVFSVNSD